MPQPSELAEISPQPLPSEASVLPPMTLTWLDLQSLHAGLKGDDDELARLDGVVINSARVLAGPDRNESRLRMVSKAIAITRAKVIMLESLLDARLNARDEQGVRLVSKVLDGANRRLVALLGEHRLACESERRPPVMVAVRQAGSVNVMAVAGGS